MSLRTITILFIGLAFVSLTSVLLVTQQVSLGRHFDAVEEQDTSSDVRRAQGLLGAELQRQQNQCRNLTEQVANVSELGLPPAGLSGWYVLQSPAPDAYGGVTSGANGIFLTAGCRLDGERQLVLVRQLDEAMLSDVSDLVQAAIMIYPLGTADPGAAMGERAQEAALSLKDGVSEVQQPVDELTMAGYALLRDPNGRPSALLEVLSPRRYYLSGMLTRNYLAVTTVLSAIIFAGTTLYVLEGLVLGRARRLSAEVSRIGRQEDHSARVSISLNDELTALAKNINNMLSSLEQSHRRREELFEQVQSAQLSLQALSRQLVSVQEEERRQIALELHDEIGQSLTGLKLLLEGGRSLPADELQPRLQRCLELANELIERVRQMSLELRPPMLDDLGLLPALLWQIDRYSQQTGIQVRFHHPGLLEQRFPDGVEIAAYRVVQEGLTNAARYAGVVSVDLHVWPADGRLEIQLEDHGHGFDADAVLAAQSSSGLSGIRERVQLLGGEFSLDTAPGQGTCLNISFPLDALEGSLP